MTSFSSEVWRNWYTDDRTQAFLDYVSQAAEECKEVLGNTNYLELTQHQTVASVCTQQGAIRAYESVIEQAKDLAGA